MKPENTYIAAVHKLLPKILHKEKMHNPYRGGTADVWYSGHPNDIWVEYKWIAKVPKKGKVVPDLSALQKEWCGGRYKEGRRVFVVVACPEGCFIFVHPTIWEDGVSVLDFKRALLDKKEYARWLTKVTTGEDTVETGQAQGSSARR